MLNAKLPSCVLTLSSLLFFVSCRDSASSTGNNANPGKTDAPAAVKKLRVVAIPDVIKDQMKEEKDRITKWLSAKLGVPAEFTTVADYNAAVTALVSNQADLGWLGGVTTVQAMQQSKGEVVPLVTREDDRKFKSYIIVRADLEAKSLQDLKGKRFTYGSPSSTSGHVMARHNLEKELKDSSEKFFGSVAYSGSHSNTILNIANGSVDAGAVNYKEFDKPGKPEIAEAVKKCAILWTTPDYVDYSWSVRKDVETRIGAGTSKKIAAAFTSLDKANPEDAAIMAIQNTNKYVEAQPAWWDGIKAVLDSIDISKLK